MRYERSQADDEVKQPASRFVAFLNARKKLRLNNKNRLFSDFLISYDLVKLQRQLKHPEYLKTELGHIKSC